MNREEDRDREDRKIERKAGRRMRVLNTKDKKRALKEI